MTEVRTQGVSTPFQDGWAGYSLGSQTSSMLGGEEEDMEAILRDLLAAFPVQTRKRENSYKLLNMQYKPENIYYLFQLFLAK